LRFWDSSAIVPLLVAESGSEAMRRLHAEDPEVVAAAITPLEVASALWRRRHRGELTLDAHQHAEHGFAILSRAWREVLYLPELTETARDLLSRHPMRSLDALQLASAIAAAGNVRDLVFVTLDDRLAAVAQAEGFPVLP
jgi:predicted nucleic acid-binding protein